MNRAEVAPQADQPLPAGAPSPYSLRILSALQGRPQYAGTVPADEVARRRAKNRQARRSRRMNRRRAAG